MSRLASAGAKTSGGVTIRLLSRFADAVQDVLIAGGILDKDANRRGLQ